MTNQISRLKRLLESKKAKEIKLENIRKACEITDKVFSCLLKKVKIGMSEMALESLVNKLVIECGAKWLAFPTIVVSGERGHNIHGIPTTKFIKKGEFVTIDFGVRVNDYCSDMTRTIFFGSKKELSKEQEKVYDLVLKANEMAIKKVKAGVLCFNIDYAAREVIRKGGYDKFFVHGVGHGITKEIHAAPTINKLSTETLRAGDIITIEPGVYLPDNLGVRIEDTVLVKKNGCEILTKSDKSLIFIKK